MIQPSKNKTVAKSNYYGEGAHACVPFHEWEVLTQVRYDWMHVLLFYAFVFCLCAPSHYALLLILCSISALLSSLSYFILCAPSVSVLLQSLHSSTFYTPSVSELLQSLCSFNLCTPSISALLQSPHSTSLCAPSISTLL